MKGTPLGTTARYVYAYGSAILFLLPVYVLVNLSIRPVTDLTPAIIPTSTPTIDNFVTAWTGSDLGQAIVNSAIVTALSVTAIVIIATAASYPLARSSARLSTATFYFFLVGLLLPFQVATLPLYIQFKDLGLLGTLWGLVIFYAGSQLPFAIFLITTFLRTSVAIEYEEAARIDGASDIRVFRSIVLPLLLPVVGTVVILVGNGIWNDFFTPLLYLSGTHNATIPVALNQFVGAFGNNWPAIFAGLIISMLPILVVFVLFQRYVIRGFAGGLKG